MGAMIQRWWFGDLSQKAVRQALGEVEVRILVEMEWKRLSCFRVRRHLQCGNQTFGSFGQQFIKFLIRRIRCGLKDPLSGINMRLEQVKVEPFARRHTFAYAVPKPLLSQLTGLFRFLPVIDARIWRNLRRTCIFRNERDDLSRRRRSERQGRHQHRPECRYIKIVRSPAHIWRVVI